MSSPTVVALPAQPAARSQAVFFVKRLAAWLLDGLLISIPIMVLAVGLQLVLLAFGLGFAGAVFSGEGLLAGGAAAGLLAGLMLLLLTPLIGAAVPLLYVRWAARRPGERAGQTLGRQALDLRVVRATEARPLRGRTLLLRELALLLWLIPAVIAGVLIGAATGSELLGTAAQLGLIAAIAWRAADGRLPHDRMTSTLVLAARP